MPSLPFPAQTLRLLGVTELKQPGWALPQTSVRTIRKSWEKLETNASASKERPFPCGRTTLPPGQLSDAGFLPL